MENAEKANNNVANDISSEIENIIDSNSEIEQNDIVNLYLGDGLDKQIYTKSIRNSRPLCVLMTGLNNCGKTTFMSTIYELFQKDQFSIYCFAGSLTLPAWEKRCHLSRIESMRFTPDTERTKFHEVSVFHLDVKSNDKVTSIYFTDIAGERYRLAKNSIEECKSITFLNRADYILILIDGQKLLDPIERNNVFIENRSLLRSFIDSQMIGHNSYVQVLFTKMDLIKNHIAQDEIDKYIDFIIERFENEFTHKLAKLIFYKVAARPANQNFEFGYNVEIVISEWFNKIPTTTFFTPKPLELIRCFDKFTFQQENLE